MAELLHSMAQLSEQVSTKLNEVREAVRDAREEASTGYTRLRDEMLCELRRIRHDFAADMARQSVDVPQQRSEIISGVLSQRAVSASCFAELPTRRPRVAPPVPPRVNRRQT